MSDQRLTLKLRYRNEDLDEAEERHGALGVPFMALAADGLGRSPDIDSSIGEIVFWPEDAAEAAGILGQARIGLPPLVSWDQSALETVDWVKHWRRFFHWTRISPTLAVGPPWEAPPEAKILIHIDPGEAFGTGTHPTTRLCLALVEEALAGREDRPALSVLDVGCGSGVLCVGARLLGAGEILGLDIEVQALDECARNALLNEAPFRASLVPVGEVEGAWDLVVANILPHVLVALAPDLAARVRPGGALILSGVPEKDESFPLRFVGAAGLGFQLVDARTEEGWWAGCFLREAP
ncbi:MAG: 50S ribosomal protein L11 methyltransferase [Pseudomonadota bacterium]